MRTFTQRLSLVLALLMLCTLAIAQETYQSVGIVGDATPLNWNESTPMQRTDAEDPHQWKLTAYLTANSLKFRANNNWDVNWGGSAFPSGTATRDGGNITIPTAGYYTITFNDASGAYNFETLNPTEYASVGIIGEATPTGWSAETTMTQGADGHTWTLSNFPLTDNELKFRANNNWDVSWGGDKFPYGFASTSAGNILAQAGNYDITFNDVTGEYFFEPLEPAVYASVGIVGSATPGGWDNSTPMKLIDPANPHEWTLTAYLTANALKFRTDNDWAINWGGSEFPDGIAVRNGGDISIPADGYYIITFNDIKATYSFFKLNPVAYETLGIVGNATPGGWDNTTFMTKGTDGHSWTIEGLTLTDGLAKFRVGNTWDIANWGGTDFPAGVATPNGGDIPVSEGVYTVTFNDITLEYNFEATGGNTSGIVITSPALPKADESLTIIYDASQGVSGLVGADQVYMHSGVVLAGPEGEAWTNVVGNWGQDDGLGEMTPVDGEPDKWQITLPSVREYYGITDDVPVFRLGMVFRNANGTQTGKSETDGDIYVELNPGDYIRFTKPAASEIFGVSGEKILLSAEASAQASSISMEINEGSGYQAVANAANAEQISYEYTIGTATSLQLRVSAEINGKMITAERTLSIVLRQPNTIAELPVGLKNGINYDPADPTKATLVLLAPGKEFVYAVGDFNNWQVSDAYQMKQTPDGDYFWLELNNLVSQQEYVFQYWVDGTIKIGDPYADKVADPYNDGGIPEEVYPNLISYTRTDDGIATVLQTGQQPYQWQNPEVVGGRPANEDLVIYELLVRDFLESHSYNDLADTLSYLKRLGVNAIELMPIMEFEGNESWGYNPSYLFAPDKYYGTKNDLKAFIDKAHAEGIAVILDMVLNHQFGQSPMVRMYFDEANGRPAENSPWFNPVPTHPFNVGYDMNHESPYTKQYMDDVNRYWIEEYKFDGYRFDLSKGFTQTDNLNDIGAWSAYDQSRVDILKRMADVIWATDESAYVILEHLGANDEEKVLADYGMMLWGNMNHPYNDVINGKTGTDLNWTLSSTRGWNEDHLISYMESHDEERLMVRAANEGSSSGDYDIKDFDIALERIKQASAFYYTLPGPKMLWQFGELGYDFPINFNGRTGNKPIPWGDSDGLNYHQDEDRVKLYKAKAAIINLVNEYTDVFEDGEFFWTPSGQMRKINISHEEMNVTIVGNFGLSEESMVPGFQQTGTWYDFFSGEAFEVTSTEGSVSLAPGEFHIYLDQPVNFPEPGLIEIYTPIVSVEPGSFTIDDQIKITFDASVADPDGTLGLIGADKVYLRAGIVTEGAESTTIAEFAGTEDQDDGIGMMTKVPGDNEKWTIVLRPREYFGIAAGENAYRIGMYFRSADGQNVGKGEEGELIFANIQQKQEVVVVEPTPFTADDEIRIIFDASQADPAGTTGLVGAEKVYMHSGVVINPTDAPTGSDWTNVVGNWGQDDGVGQMSKVPGSDNLWEITLKPRNYYGLDAETSVYYLSMVFRNAAGNAEGKGPGGSDVFIRVAEGAPAVPSNLMAEVEETLSVKLSWTDNADNELAYVLERKAEDQETFEVLAILDENISSFVDTETIDGTTYEYQVKAISAFAPDSDYSNVAVADLPLLAPTSLDADAPDLFTVLLNWEDRSQNETSYIIERAVQRGSRMSDFVEIASLGTDVVSYTDMSDIRAGLYYHYRVMALDEDESSEYSEVISLSTVDRLARRLRSIVAESISMYPNPASDVLTVSLAMELEASMRFSLTNMMGEKLRAFNLVPGKENMALELDISDLPDGLYILQATYMDVSVNLRLEVKH